MKQKSLFLQKSPSVKAKGLVIIKKGLAPPVLSLIVKWINS